MPTFENPIADAEESSEAVRGLAHATRAMNPADTYPVLGDLIALTRSLQQVTEQLATVHETSKDRALDDDGNRLVGERAALSAWMELRQAAGLLSQAERHIDAALSHSGRIAWQPESGQAQPRRQYVLLRELFGGEAKRALTVLSTLGEADAFDYLTNRGDEARLRQEALDNGYVYQTLAAHPGSIVLRQDKYTLVTHPESAQVLLYADFEPERDPEPAPHPLVDPTARGHRAATPLPGRITPRLIGASTNADAEHGPSLPGVEAFGAGRSDAAPGTGLQR
ncbi:MAG: hypothetical protein ACK5LO_07730 [Leucobacter sp.]